jgi:hypothetical protein
MFFLVGFYSEKILYFQAVDLERITNIRVDLWRYKRKAPGIYAGYFALEIPFDVDFFEGIVGEVGGGE